MYTDISTMADAIRCGTVLLCMWYGVSCHQALIQDIIFNAFNEDWHRSEIISFSVEKYFRQKLLRSMCLLCVLALSTSHHFTWNACSTIITPFAIGNATNNYETWCMQTMQCMQGTHHFPCATQIGLGIMYRATRELCCVAPFFIFNQEINNMHVFNGLQRIQIEQLSWHAERMEKHKDIARAICHLHNASETRFKHNKKAFAEFYVQW